MYHNIQNETIRKLCYLIQDFEDEEKELSDMVSRWENEDDPGSDPGLQYEQESKKETAYNNIKDFLSKM